MEVFTGISEEPTASISRVMTVGSSLSLNLKMETDPPFKMYIIFIQTVDSVQGKFSHLDVRPMSQILKQLGTMHNIYILK